MLRLPSPAPAATLMRASEWPSALVSVVRTWLGLGLGLGGFGLGLGLGLRLAALVRVVRAVSALNRPRRPSACRQGPPPNRNAPGSRYSDPSRQAHTVRTTPEATATRQQTAGKASDSDAPWVGLRVGLEQRRARRGHEHGGAHALLWRDARVAYLRQQARARARAGARARARARARSQPAVAYEHWSRVVELIGDVRAQLLQLLRVGGEVAARLHELERVALVAGGAQQLHAHPPHVGLLRRPGEKHERERPHGRVGGREQPDGTHARLGPTHPLVVAVVEGAERSRSRSRNRSHEHAFALVATDGGALLAIQNARLGGRQSLEYRSPLS
eukprot:scaffold20770_cov65-Phaeocystis_antarctica.AAC.6